MSIFGGSLDPEFPVGTALVKIHLSSPGSKSQTRNRAGMWHDGLWTIGAIFQGFSAGAQESTQFTVVQQEVIYHTQEVLTSLRQFLAPVFNIVASP